MFIKKSPTSNSAQNFTKEGFCIFSNHLSSIEINRNREHLDKTLLQMPRKKKFVIDGIEKEVDARPEYLTEPHVDDKYWLELCCHTKILDAVESILGPDLILLMSHLIVKMPYNGLPVAWHQDLSYWETIQGDNIATVWLAIDDTDNQNGCMRVIPQSHQPRHLLENTKTDGKDLLGSKVNVSAISEKNAIDIELRAGSFSIHDSFLIHCSNANKSDRRRAGYTMRYANANTTRINFENHWVPIYYVRGDDKAMKESYVDIRR